MTNVIIAFSIFSSILISGIIIKNSFDKITDEIKTEIACLATKNNNDIQDIAKRLKTDSGKGIYVKIYAEDYPGKKAEKLYEICETNTELVKVLLQLETLVEKEE